MDDRPPPVDAKGRRKDRPVTRADDKVLLGALGWRVRLPRAQRGMTRPILAAQPGDSERHHE